MSGRSSILARVKLRLPAIGLFVGGIAAWEALVRILNIKGFILPAPTAIAATFGTETSALLGAGVGTFSTALGGLVLGATMAVVTALAATRWRFVRDGALPFAIAANSTPIIVLAPIANSWFGLRNPAGSIFVVAILVFFPVMINLVRGLLSAGVSHLELMESYAAGRMTTLWKIRFPNAAPYLFSALKVAAALSLIGAIVKEFFGGSQDRLGQYITTKAGLLQFEEAWAAIVLASVFGIALYGIVVQVERRAIPWHVSVRSSGSASGG